MMNRSADVKARDNWFSDSSLNLATRFGDKMGQLFKLLLNAGADVNRKAGNGWTPLHNMTRT